MTSNTYAVSGKSVLVTGAGSGIGRAVARAFLDQGARVAVSGRRLEPLEETLAGHPAEQGLAVSSDVSDPADVRALVEQVVEHFGSLDVVVSNAALHVAGDVLDVSAEDWERLRATNVDGFFHLAQAALPALERSGGNLVAVTSVSALNGDWGQAVYNASKHAVSGFVTSLALDWGARGVRVNAVAPAFTVSPLTQDMASSDEQLAPFVDRVALGRVGQPEDIAPAVLFLASPDAGYVTGATLRVDGGTSASTGQPHVG